jgi:hypothetical protein
MIIHLPVDTCPQFKTISPRLINIKVREHRVRVLSKPHPAATAVILQDFEGVNR